MLGGAFPTIRRDTVAPRYLVRCKIKSLGTNQDRGGEVAACSRNKLEGYHAGKIVLKIAFHSAEASLVELFCNKNA
jgi:hypothetical protein